MGYVNEMYKMMAESTNEDDYYGDEPKDYEAGS